MALKMCSACHETKPIHMFAKNDRNRHRSTCKSCGRAYWRQLRTFRLAAGIVVKRDSTPSVQRWRAANPEKDRAIRVVRNALKYGRLERQPCERCGSTTRIHAHHESYDRPLDVMWLCHDHHMERHRELRALRQQEAA